MSKRNLGCAALLLAACTQTATITEGGDELGSVPRLLDFAALPPPPVSPEPVRQYEYDAQGNLKRLVVAPELGGTGLVTLEHHDTHDEVTDVIDPAQGTVHLDYDGLGQVTAVTDPRGLQTRFEPTGLGTIARGSSPDKGQVTRAHDAAGNVTLSVDARGVTTELFHDALGRVERVEHRLPGAPPEQYTYSYDTLVAPPPRPGTLTKTLPPTPLPGWTWATAPNPYQRPNIFRLQVFEQRALTHLTLTVNLTHGDPAALKVRLQSSTGFSKDLMLGGTTNTFELPEAAGQATAGTWALIVEDPLSMRSGTLDVFSLTFHSPAPATPDPVRPATDDDFVWDSYWYPDDVPQASTSVSQTLVSRIEVDGALPIAGLKVSVSALLYTAGTFNQPLEQTYELPLAVGRAANGTWTLSVNAQGSMTLTGPGSFREELWYPFPICTRMDLVDWGLNFKRLIEPPPPPPTRVEVSTFPAGSQTTEGTGACVPKHTQVVGGVTHTVEYECDASGLVTAITYPSGRKVGYLRGPDGRVTGVSLTSAPKAAAVGLLHDVRFSPFGAVKHWAWDLATGPEAHSRLFDSAGRMVRYVLGGTVRDLTWDEANRLVAFTHFDGSSAAALPTLNQGFGYDLAGRLTHWDTATTTRRYTYDASGNRTSLTVDNAGQSVVIDPGSNRLGDAQHDPSGNVTAHGDAASTYWLSGRRATFTRDQVTTAYDYDASGLRVRKASANGVTLFVYDAWSKLLGEYDGNGRPLREYVWLEETPIAMLVPDPAGASAPVVFFIHADHLDTPRVVVDLLGRARWRWTDADPFGQSSPDDDPSGLGAFTQNLRFPGQYADAESGQFYNVYRDYDPATGRYLESDPAGLAAGINTYAYVEGDPLTSVDPLGLRTLFVNAPAPAPQIAMRPPVQPLEVAPSGLQHFQGQLERLSNYGDGIGALSGASDKYGHGGVPNALEKLINPERVMKGDPFVPRPPSAIGPGCRLVAPPASPANMCPAQQHEPKVDCAPEGYLGPVRGWENRASKPRWW